MNKVNYTETVTRTKKTGNAPKITANSMYETSRLKLVKTPDVDDDIRVKRFRIKRNNK